MTGTLARLAMHRRAGALPPLILMTDDVRLPDPLAAAATLPQGSLVILRTRGQDRRRALAAALAGIARRRGLFLSVADDAALAARADGVHIPEAQAGTIAQWRARRPDLLITTSAHSLKAVLRAAALGADAVLLSPVFPTASHPGAAALGTMRLRRVALDVPVAVYALGGVTARTARQLAGAPVAGFAAVGALAA